MVLIALFLPQATMSTAELATKADIKVSKPSEKKLNNYYESEEGAVTLGDPVEVAKVDAGTAMVDDLQQPQDQIQNDADIFNIPKQVFRKKLALQDRKQSVPENATLPLGSPAASRAAAVKNAESQEPTTRHSRSRGGAGFGGGGRPSGGLDADADLDLNGVDGGIANENGLIKPAWHGNGFRDVIEVYYSGGSGKLSEFQKSMSQNSFKFTGPVFNQQVFDEDEIRSREQKPGEKAARDGTKEFSWSLGRNSLMVEITARPAQIGEFVEALNRSDSVLSLNLIKPSGLPATASGGLLFSNTEQDAMQQSAEGLRQMELFSGRARVLAGNQIAKGVRLKANTAEDKVAGRKSAELYKSQAKFLEYFQDSDDRLSRYLFIVRTEDEASGSAVSPPTQKNR